MADDTLRIEDYEPHCYHTGKDDKVLQNRQAAERVIPLVKCVPACRTKYYAADMMP